MSERPVQDVIALDAAAERDAQVLVEMPGGSLQSMPARQLKDMWAKGYLTFIAGEIHPTAEGLRAMQAEIDRRQAQDGD